MAARLLSFDAARSPFGLRPGDQPRSRVDELSLNEDDVMENIDLEASRALLGGKPRSIDDYVATLEPDQQAIVTALRALVREAAPEAKEAFKWAQPVWEFNGPACYVKAFRAATNFGFWRGAELAERVDHEGLLLGDGGKMRHVKLTNVEEIRPEPLQRLIRAAVDLNQRFGDPTRGASTRAV
jgi:hypothetical protein